MQESSEVQAEEFKPELLENETCEINKCTAKPVVRDHSVCILEPRSLIRGLRVA